MTNKLTDHRMEGNFPVDQYQIEAFHPETGEVSFTKRISRQDRFLNKSGQEIPDPRPMSPALGRKPEMHIRDYIRSLVHSERLMQDLEAQGVETFEEANDFEVGEDYFPDSAYENDLEPTLAELIREGTASLSAKARGAEKREHASKEARRAELREEAAAPPSQPVKSPRKARRAMPEASEEADLGDHHPREGED